jgi:release factor glutamine methyltransferase
VNLSQLTRRLAPHTETPGLDARVLFCHILGKTKTWLLAHPEAQPNPDQAAALETAARRIENGEPLPYVLGNWEFYGLDFYVSPDVLIPRPETELLIDLALAQAATRATLEPGLRFIDIGTGSGIIPVTLATRLPNAEIHASDISPAALAIARKNAEKHRVEGRIEFCEADLFEARKSEIDTRYSKIGNRYSILENRITNIEYRIFDLITSNPPYIPTSTLRELPIYGREPTLALDGGPDGLEVIRRLLGQSKRYLAPGGTLLLEIEYRQGTQVTALARENFPDADIHIHKDLAGYDRALAVVT